MRLRRLPRFELRPFVDELWFSDQPATPDCPGANREYTLPTGHMHIVFRLSEQPVRLFRDVLDSSGVNLGCAVVGGARAAFYVKEVGMPAAVVGAALRPGASHPLFGAPAVELAGRHTRLDDLWGSQSGAALGQLADAADPATKLDLLERLLAARLSPVRAMHPAVALALARFEQVDQVREVIAETGYSHRRFIELFRDSVGLAPKLYCRVRRFQRALTRNAGNPNLSWVDLALVCGYSDQAHFNREFAEFAGMRPGEYQAAAPAFPHHVRAGSIFFNTREAGRLQTV